MEKLIEEYDMHNNKLAPIKCIYGLIPNAHSQVKKYIKYINLNLRFNKWKTDPCLLLIVKQIWTDIIIVYVEFIL